MTYFYNKTNLIFPEPVQQTTATVVWPTYSQPSSHVILPPLPPPPLQLLSSTSSDYHLSSSTTLHQHTQTQSTRLVAVATDAKRKLPLQMPTTAATTFIKIEADSATLEQGKTTLQTVGTMTGGSPVISTGIPDQSIAPLVTTTHVIYQHHPPTNLIVSQQTSTTETICRSQATSPVACLTPPPENQNSNDSRGNFLQGVQDASNQTEPSVEEENSLEPKEKDQDSLLIISSKENTMKEGYEETLQVPNELDITPPPDSPISSPVPLQENEFNRFQQNEFNRFQHNDFNTFQQNELNRLQQNEFNRFQQNELNRLQQNELNRFQQTELNRLQQNELNILQQNEFNRLQQNEFSRTVMKMERFQLSSLVVGDGTIGRNLRVDSAVSTIRMNKNVTTYDTVNSPVDSCLNLKNGVDSSITKDSNKVSESVFKFTPASESPSLPKLKPIDESPSTGESLSTRESLSSGESLSIGESLSVGESLSIDKVVNKLPDTEELSVDESLKIESNSKSSLNKSNLLDGSISVCESSTGESFSCETQISDEPLNKLPTCESLPSNDSSQSNKSVDDSIDIPHVNSSIPSSTFDSICVDKKYVKLDLVNSQLPKSHSLKANSVKLNCIKSKTANLRKERLPSIESQSLNLESVHSNSIKISSLDSNPSIIGGKSVKLRLNESSTTESSSESLLKHSDSFKFNHLKTNLTKPSPKDSLKLLSLNANSVNSKCLKTDSLKTDAVKADFSKSISTRVDFSTSTPTKVDSSKSTFLKAGSLKTTFLKDNTSKVASSKADLLKVTSSKTSYSKPNASKSTLLNVGQSKIKSSMINTSTTEIKKSASLKGGSSSHSSLEDAFRSDSMKKDLVKYNSLNNSKIGSPATDSVVVDFSKKESSKLNGSKVDLRIDSPKRVSSKVDSLNRSFPDTGFTKLESSKVDSSKVDSSKVDSSIFKHSNIKSSKGDSLKINFSKGDSSKLNFSKGDSSKWIFSNEDSSREDSSKSNFLKEDYSKRIFFKEDSSKRSFSKEDSSIADSTVINSQKVNSTKLSLQHWNQSKLNSPKRIDSPKLRVSKVDPLKLNLAKVNANFCGGDIPKTNLSPRMDTQKATFSIKPKRNDSMRDLNVDRDFSSDKEFASSKKIPSSNNSFSPETLTFDPPSLNTTIKLEPSPQMASPFNSLTLNIPSPGSSYLSNSLFSNESSISIPSSESSVPPFICNQPTKYFSNASLSIQTESSPKKTNVNLISPYKMVPKEEFTSKIEQKIDTKKQCLNLKALKMEVNDPKPDISGLELLSNSIVEFEKHRNDTDKIKIKTEVEDVSKFLNQNGFTEKETGTKKVDDGLGGLDLLCALAEQRIMEEVSENNCSTEVSSSVSYDYFKIK